MATIKAAAAEHAAAFQTNYLFVLAHAGETNELLPLLKHFAHEGRSFQILAIGTAQELVARTIKRVASLRFHCLNISFWKAIEKTHPISQATDSDQISALFDEVQPRFVVTGVATEIQKQFLEEAQKRNITSYAYWDNPFPEGKTPYFIQAQKTQALASFVLFPTQFVADYFSTRPPQTKYVVGKPTLQSKIAQIQGSDPAKIRHKLPFSSPTNPIITFVGTKGSDYALALHDFCRWASKKDSNVILRTHPASDTLLERDLATVFLPRHYISENTDPLLTFCEALAVASLVVTYDSSVGFEAFAAGKKVAHIIPLSVPEATRYSNAFLDQGLIRTIKTELDLDLLLDKLSSDPSEKTAFSNLNMPVNDCIERMINALTSHFTFERLRS
jgi:hypothetical protein